MNSSPGTGSRIHSPGRMLVFLLLLLGLSHAYGLDEQTDRRRLVGLKLFPSVVAADQSLFNKLGPDGQLHLVFLYLEDEEGARDAAGRVAALGPIRNLPVKVTTLPFARLRDLNTEPPAALFLVDSSPHALAAAMTFGNGHHRLVFSPHHGDVTAGAHAGIFIGDRILPLVNPDTLSAAEIVLKPFLLEVAKTHE